MDIDSIDPTDTTNYKQQIIYWLNRIQTLSAKYDLIENYFTAQNFTAADNALAAIPNDFTLSEDQQQAYNDYVYFYQYKKALHDNGLDLSMLDNGQINVLLTFTQGDLNFAKGLAQNALCFYYDICREDDYDLGSGNRMMHHTPNAPSSINTNEKNIASSNNKVTVAPNPASNAATFSYTLSEVKEQPILSICDITGKEIAKFSLKNNQGELTWDTSKINNGVYYYSVKDGDAKIAKGKISVKK